MVKNKLGKACSDFRIALNKIGYTSSNLMFEYPKDPKNIDDVLITIVLKKIKK
jgi:hypothetical protein